VWVDAVDKVSGEAGVEPNIVFAGPLGGRFRWGSGAMTQVTDN
jgi:hypothetical protein